MRQDGESVRAHIPWLVEGPCALTGGLSAITEKCHQPPGNLTGRFIKLSQIAAEAMPPADESSRDSLVVVQQAAKALTPVDPPSRRHNARPSMSRFPSP